MNGAKRIAPIAALLIVVGTISFSVPSAGQTDEQIGSEWVYSLTNEYLGAVHYTGNWTFSSERIVNSTIGDTQKEATLYHSLIVANGSAAENTHTYNWTMIISDDLYYDLDTSNLIGYLSYRHYEEHNESGEIILEHSLDELNETKYTPPGGSGTEPSALEAGDNWTKTYTKVSNVSGYEGGKYFEEEFTVSETLEYTFIGFETITVPAGVFSCSKFEITSSDGTIETSWYASEISGYAKIEDAYQPFDVTTYELTAYHQFEIDSESGTIEMGSDLFIGAFFVFIAATVIAAAYASIIVKRGQNSPEQKPDIGAPPTPPSWHP